MFQPPTPPQSHVPSGEIPIIMNQNWFGGPKLPGISEEKETEPASYGTIKLRQGFRMDPPTHSNNNKGNINFIDAESNVVLSSTIPSGGITQQVLLYLHNKK